MAKFERIPHSGAAAQGTANTIHSRGNLAGGWWRCWRTGPAPGAAAASCRGGGLARAVSPAMGCWSLPTRPGRRRFRPGLVSHWTIRRRANIDYGTEADADFEYVATRSFRGDLGILAQALLTLPFGPNTGRAGGSLPARSSHLDNLTLSEAVEQVVARAGGDVPTQVCFVNADCVNIAFRDSAYRRVVQAAPLVLADGIGIKLAGRDSGPGNPPECLRHRPLPPALRGDLRHAVGAVLAGRSAGRGG